jgi:5-methylcytosine-specific restriction endonuclease McrA
MSGSPDPKPVKRVDKAARPLGKTRIRSLRLGEPRPEGEPKRYADPRGYVRLRWKVRKLGSRSYAQEFAEIRPRILARAQHECEVALPRCERRAVHVHHRKLRSQGGKNDSCNLIAACSPCHRDVHASPARAYAAGWMVRSTEDPALVPAQLARGLMMIGNDLRYYVPEPSAMMPV